VTAAAAEPNALAGLLNGLRVVDLTRNLPGPFCTRLLADLGAEVIKVEPPEGDPSRALGPLFDALNHGKESRRIDFRDPIGLNLLRSWLADADVMLDSFRPGTLQALKLHHGHLGRINPRLVMVSITGYGQHGPWAQRAGHDLNFMAMSGALDQSRTPSGALAMSNVQWGDLVGGSAMAGLAALAAVFEAQRSGHGRHVDVSMTHGLHAHLILPTATAALLTPLLGHPPGAGEDLLNGGLPCYNLYATADARQLAVAALEFKFWKAACAVFERPAWVERHWQRGQLPGSPDCVQLRAEIAALVATQPLAWWMERFEPVDACVTPVLTLQEALRHPLFTDHTRPQPWAAVAPTAIQPEHVSP
jgi:crotonobetainyl-CoA:carnitine CoA-transferase CaiB-like acyl-CoA transferase